MADNALQLNLHGEYFGLLKCDNSLVATAPGTLGI